MGAKLLLFLCLKENIFVFKFSFFLEMGLPIFFVVTEDVFVAELTFASEVKMVEA